MPKTLTSLAALPDIGDDLLVAIAELYYKDGRTQKDIADRLGVSRATVINYLKQCRDDGIVEISIKGSAYVGSEEAMELRQRYGLKEVYVTRTEFKDTDDEAHLSVARLGASALAGLLRSGDKIGVAWGRTIQLMAEEVRTTKATDLSVCQMWGAVNSTELLSSEASTIRLAENLGAQCHTLHAPAILSSGDLAERLRNEPVVHEQLERLEHLDKVIFSLGGTTAHSTIVSFGMVTDEQLAQFRADGARAVLCGHVLNADGLHIERDFSTRIIGVSPDQLAQVACRICLASRHHDADAVRAALRGGLVTHLVIDHELARALLKNGG